MTAKSALTLAKWWRSSKDAAAQEKILAELHRNGEGESGQ